MIETLVISTIVLWALVLINLLITLALVRRVTSSDSRIGSMISQSRPLGLKEGEAAPDFVAETLQGELVRLAHFLGTSTTFVFIKPGCQPCAEQLPDLERLYQAAQGQREKLVLVSVGTPDGTRDLVAEFGITCPLLIAPQESNQFMSDYQMFGTPSFTYIDTQGTVRRTGRPNRNMPDWQWVITRWETAPDTGTSMAASVAPASGGG